jgi:hypothetical protein
MIQQVQHDFQTLGSVWQLRTSLLHYTSEEVKKLESEGAVYGSAAL